MSIAGQAAASRSIMAGIGEAGGPSVSARSSAPIAPFVSTRVTAHGRPWSALHPPQRRRHVVNPTATDSTWFALKADNALAVQTTFKHGGLHR